MEKKKKKKKILNGGRHDGIKFLLIPVHALFEKSYEGSITYYSGSPYLSASPYILSCHPYNSTSSYSYKFLLIDMAFMRKCSVCVLYFFCYLWITLVTILFDRLSISTVTTTSNLNNITVQEMVPLAKQQGVMQEQDHFQRGWKINRSQEIRVKPMEQGCMYQAQDW